MVGEDYVEVDSFRLTDKIMWASQQLVSLP